tara:strand:- start:1250 stop:1927 length:678 start_codon:yes stop_codon:yes gene_type:complete
MSYKLKYWIDKLPEVQDNLEPVTQTMIRLSGEVQYYAKHHSHTKRTDIVNTNDINLLHSIDRKPALDKFNKRRKFLLNNKKKLGEMIKEMGYIDLRDKFFEESPFKSINNELLVEIKHDGRKKKYITASGVGRVAAFHSVFKKGVNVKMDILKVHYSLQKRLVAVNNLYIYGNRFQNLKKYEIYPEEIVFTRKKPKTYKRYNRKRFVKTQKRKLMNKFIPYMGGK